jgi:transcriptional regulator with XRE-family HTH domain
MKFGPHLKELRLRAGITQSQLAQKCRLTSTYINQLEKEKTDPPTRHVCRALARALGIEERDLRRYAFIARLERWVRKEGYKKIPDRLASSLFETIDSPRDPGLSTTGESKNQ